MTKDKDYPRESEWTSFREFEADKRADMRELLRAVDQFCLGCAYVPGYDDYAFALDQIKQWSDAMRIAWRHSQARRTPRGKNG
jgi:hypothetical protein